MTDHLRDDEAFEPVTAPEAFLQQRLAEARVPLAAAFTLLDNAIARGVEGKFCHVSTLTDHWNVFVGALMVYRQQLEAADD